MTDEKCDCGTGPDQKHVRDPGGKWAAGVGAVHGKVSLILEDDEEDCFGLLGMHPDKARELAHALLSQADAAEGRVPS